MAVHIAIPQNQLVELCHKWRVREVVYAAGHYCGRGEEAGAVLTSASRHPTPASSPLPLALRLTS